MVSDQEIASCVESVLRGYAGGPGEASLVAVLQQAEATLGVDLSHKAGFIRDQMDLFFGPHLQPQPPTKPQLAPPSPQVVVGPAAAVPQLQPQHQVLPQVQAQAQPPPPAQQMQTHPQQEQLAQLQPRLIFQAMPQLPAMAPVPATVSAPPAVPAMAFYPPPPLAFRYTTGLGGAATGGTVSFQQPAPGAGSTASSTPPAQVAGDNKESASKKKRGGPGGLNKVCAISPELQTIVGETAMSRTQIVKQLWAYIRQNNLQDPDDKRKIICNDELRVVFETDATDMFKMNKLLAKHITPLDPKDQRGEKRMKATTVALQPGPPMATNVALQPRPPIIQPSIVISDALAKFIGTDGTFSQDDALKYLWDYIKANQLEDVINGSILCDSKLQELFGCESIPMSGLSEMLGHHFIKKT